MLLERRFSAMITAAAECRRNTPNRGQRKEETSSKISEPLYRALPPSPHPLGNRLYTPQLLKVTGPVLVRWSVVRSGGTGWGTFSRWAGWGRVASFIGFKELRKNQTIELTYIRGIAHRTSDRDAEPLPPTRRGVSDGTDLVGA